MKRGSLVMILVVLVLVGTGCAPVTPQVIEKEVVVEKPVVQTVLVEVEKQVEKQVVQTVIVEKEVEKQVEKQVVQTVIVEKEVEKVVTATPRSQELWYNPAELGASFINICPNTPPTYGGTIASVRAMPPMKGDNWFQFGGDGFLFSHLLMPSGNGGWEPDVAKSWDVSADGLTYTFHLRDDVKFHNGDRLTAADVKFTLQMFTTKELAGPYRSVIQPIAGFDAWDKGEADEITGIKIVDDYTVQLTLNSFRSDFFRTFANARIPIWPKGPLADIPFTELPKSEFAVEHPIGSGPWKMGKFVPDQYYIYEAFEDYYGGRPYLDRIIFRIGLDRSDATWMAALEAGEVHEGTMVNGPDRLRLGSNSEIVIVGGQFAYALNIWPNHEKLPDKRVLQAMMYALDRQAIADGVWGDDAGVWDYTQNDPKAEWVSPNITKYNYDPAKAKALLAEANWDSSQELELIYYYPQDVHKRTLEAAQQYWADVGIKVNLSLLDIPAFVERFYKTLDFDLGYGAGGEPQPELYSRWSCANLAPDGNNAAMYCNEEFDALVTSAIGEPDPEKRTAIWHQVTEIANDELVDMPLLSQQRVFAARKELCNYVWAQTDSFVERRSATWYLASK